MKGANYPLHTLHWACQISRFEHSAVVFHPARLVLITLNSNQPLSSPHLLIGMSSCVRGTFTLERVLFPLRFLIHSSHVIFVQSHSCYSAIVHGLHWPSSRFICHSAWSISLLSFFICFPGNLSWNLIICQWFLSSRLTLFHFVDVSVCAQLVKCKAQDSMYFLLWYLQIHWTSCDDVQKP